MMMKKLISIFLLTFFLLSCETERPEVESQSDVDEITQQEDDPSEDLNGEDPIVPDPPLEEYKACNLVDLNIDPALGSPDSIGDAVALINALPKPLTIACFVSALNRPLNLNLTTSTISVQPAIGVSNPRIFIINLRSYNS